MKFLIRDNGPLNEFFLSIGIISEPLHIINTNFAVQLGLFYSYLPFMVLPIYAAVERYNFALSEAAADLYASRTVTLTKVILPTVKPGIIVDVNLSIGNLKLCDPERCSIAKKLFWTNGNIIPKEDNFALEYFINLSKNSKYIFDIGANSGIFALSSALVNPKAKIYTFDILPESMHILNKNIHLNGFSNLIKSNLIGVGANSYFDAPKGNVSSEMPTSVKLDSKYPNIDTIKVEIKTLDNIFTDLQVSDLSLIHI